MKTQRGFTLIELMVTITMVAILLAVVVPYLTGTITNARARNVVSKFTQDFSWLRNQAATGNRTITLVLNADCNWSSTINGVVDNAHSLTGTELLASSAAFSCVAGNNTALPVTFSFTNQGNIAQGANVTFMGPNNRNWPLQVLTSGTIVILRGDS